MARRNLKTLHRMLERMTSEQLDAMLESELKREPVDAEAVRLILRILKERDGLYSQRDRKAGKPKTPKTERWKKWAARAACIAAVFALLVTVVPGVVQADPYMYRVLSWKEKFLEIFGIDGQDSFFATYVYATENEQLQQVRTEAEGQDMMLPSVPMWIPEEFRLEGCAVEQTPDVTTLKASFGMEEKELTIQVQKHTSPVTFTPESHMTVHERYGIIHYIFRENGTWVVVWTNEDQLCTLRADCEESTLLRIMESVYFSLND